MPESSDKEAAIPRCLKRKPKHPKTAAYVATLVPPQPKSRQSFVINHEPRHYGRFVEDAPIYSPENVKKARKAKEKLDAYQTAMKRVRAVVREYPLAPAVPIEFEDVEPHVRHIIRRGRAAPAPAPSRISRWNCRPEGHRNGNLGKAYPKPGLRDVTQCETQRASLMEAQEGVCPCGSAITDEKPSLDHVVPRSLGGADRLGNLLVMHGICNGRKSNDIPTGCELIWLLAVNARLGVEPVRW